jgi:competence protein ComFA
MDKKDSFVCPRCGNHDLRYIGKKNGLPYCRLCLPFNGKEAEPDHWVHSGIRCAISYPLSSQQKKVSQQVFNLLCAGKNVFIHAVTGAGKTELVYQSMEACLAKGGHVGFATPRKDVVIDLLPRIQEAFPSAYVISVYGSHSAILEGDIVILTTHQLYRYPHYFDLLILDEIDAFPYQGDALLKAFFHRSIRGNYVLLSATPSSKDLEDIRQDNGEVVTLFERYHGGLLPLPKVITVAPFTSYFRCLFYLRQFLRKGKPVFVFVPTIGEGKKLFAFLHLFFSRGRYVSSEEDTRKIEIERFRAGELSYLVTTTILERGVTVKDLQVIVFQTDHCLYTSSVLVQIAGRVGRKIGAISGEVLFLSETETPAIKEAITAITHYNERFPVL